MVEIRPKYETHSESTVKISRRDNPVNSNKFGGLINRSAEQEKTLNNYVILVHELETKVKYLEAINRASRRYMSCLSNKSTAKNNGGIKNVKQKLFDALDIYEELERVTWAKS